MGVIAWTKPTDAEQVALHRTMQALPEATIVVQDLDHIHIAGTCTVAGLRGLVAQLEAIAARPVDAPVVEG